MQQNEVRQEYLTGERALFMSRDLKVYDSVFAEGESPLKARTLNYMTVCFGGSIRCGIVIM